SPACTKDPRATRPGGPLMSRVSLLPFAAGQVVAALADGLQGVHGVGERLDAHHVEFAVGGGLGGLGAAVGGDEEVLGAVALGADHLLRDAADPADLAVGADGAGTGDADAAGDALLAEPVDDPEGEHHARAGAADLAD